MYPILDNLRWGESHISAEELYPEALRIARIVADEDNMELTPEQADSFFHLQVAIEGNMNHGSDESSTSPFIECWCIPGYVDRGTDTADPERGFILCTARTVNGVQGYTVSFISIDDVKAVLTWDSTNPSSEGWGGYDPDKVISDMFGMQQDYQFNLIINASEDQQ